MAKLVIQPGERYGRLAIIRETEKLGRDRAFVCLCDCGNEHVARLRSMRYGSVQSCGCLQRERADAVRVTHGESGTRLYRIWYDIKRRCLDPNRNGYPDYGGRGIKICDDWLRFEPFLEWATSNGYEEHLTIERIDVDGDYEPSNCTWIPRSGQNLNTRRNTWLTAWGETKILKHWAEEYGHPYGRILARLKRGWSLEEALLTPRLRGRPLRGQGRHEG